MAEHDRYTKKELGDVIWWFSNEIAPGARTLKETIDLALRQMGHRDLTDEGRVALARFDRAG